MPKSSFRFFYLFIFYLLIQYVYNSQWQKTALLQGIITSKSQSEYYQTFFL